MFVKSNNEYIIRYNDVNKKKIVPLQSKINNFYFDELHMYPSNITEGLSIVMMKNFLENVEKYGIRLNDPKDFVETTLDDDADEFIMLEVENNTSAVRNKYRNDLVFILYSVFNDFPQSSLVQYRY